MCLTSFITRRVVGETHVTVDGDPAAIYEDGTCGEKSGHTKLLEILKDRGKCKVRGNREPRFGQSEGLLESTSGVAINGESHTEWDEVMYGTYRCVSEDFVVCKLPSDPAPQKLPP